MIILFLYNIPKHHFLNKIDALIAATRGKVESIRKVIGQLGCWETYRQRQSAAAYEIVVRIKKAGDSLAQYPQSGRVGRVKGTRELVVAGTAYLLPYRIKGDEIQILHVFHIAQKWPDKF
jgi:plasmid stabilization system protein ParE